MAITKLKPNPLSGFHDLKPSLNLTNKCTLTVTPNYIFLNKQCFKHFKGSCDLKVACNTDQNSIAVIDTYTSDPNVLSFSLSKGNKNYNNFMNKGLLKNLDKTLPQLGISQGQHTKICADPDDIGENYIIFRADKKHLKQCQE